MKGFFPSFFNESKQNSKVRYLMIFSYKPGRSKGPLPAEIGIVKAIRDSSLNTS